MTIAIIHGSSRENGNTEYLTYQAISKEKGTHIYLRDHSLHPIIDERHAVDGFQEVNDNHKKLIDQILTHDVIVFSTPIYWYSMSGPMKIFIDRSSQIMRDPDYTHFKEGMKGKKVYVIAVGGDQPRIKGLPLIQQFQYICQYYSMSFEGYVIGKASKPGDIKKDKKAIAAASILLKDITE